MIVTIYSWTEGGKFFEVKAVSTRASDVAYTDAASCFGLIFTGREENKSFCQ